MNELPVLNLLLATLLALPALYLAVLALAALTTRKASGEGVSPSARIAFVVPAHDEELLIERTVNSCHNSRLPAGQSQVFVIADNCSDQTASLAAEAGAFVAVRNQPQDRGKGQALSWFLGKYRGLLEDFDYVAMVDADTLVDPDFLRAAVSVMEADGHEVVQGRYGVESKNGHWRGRLMAAALDLAHHLRPLGRERLGGTAGLKGNGMVFRRALLLELGWPAHSIVEDAEMTLRLLDQGVRVHYEPGARVYGAVAQQESAASTQRKRWEDGRRQLLIDEGTGLFAGFCKRPRVATLDAFFDLMCPPLVNYLLLLALSGAVGFVLGLSLIPKVALGALVLSCAVVLVSAAKGGDFRGFILALPQVPRFFAWKALYLGRRALMGFWNRGRKEEAATAWVRTPRGDPETGGQLPSPLWSRARKKLHRLAVAGVRASKRTIDLIGSMASLLMLAPLFALVAILIKLEDRGPVFFRQTRVGEQGRTFGMWKFRSMKVNAEAIKESLIASNEHGCDGVTFKMKSDPRITRIGRWLRKFSIDEMPQFLNVLLGDMSLVGPRPPVPKEVAKYSSIELRRLTVRPGLSCLWQVQGRADIDFAGQVKLDIRYIHSFTLLRDFVILLKTVPAVVSGRGAY